MKKKIVVIDDDQDILSILEIILEEDGFEPVLFNTGLTAQQILDVHPDLLLLDVRIAGCERTGVEICREVKAAEVDLPFSILLFSSEDDLEELSISCGADGYINKPFNIDRFSDKLRKFVT